MAYQALFGANDKKSYIGSFFIKSNFKKVQIHHKIILLTFDFLKSFSISSVLRRTLRNKAEPSSRILPIIPESPAIFNR